MARTAVLLIRGASLSKAEGDAIHDLRQRYRHARIVRVRRGQEGYLEPADAVYSFHKDLLSFYDNGTLLGGPPSGKPRKADATPKANPGYDEPLPDPYSIQLLAGMKLDNNGPWFSLTENGVELLKVRGRAKAHEAITEYLNGRVG